MGQGRPKTVGERERATGTDAGRGVTGLAGLAGLQVVES